MPFLLYLLALAVFAQGTSEFMLAGLLPDLAADFGVSVPHAGLLTTAFAVGMVAGAPAMATFGRQWPPRWTLTGFLGLFVVSHAIGAVTDSFALLLVTRGFAAISNAGFLAVTLSTVALLVPTELRARALAVVLGGTTLALVAGVPAGAALGAELGWRSTLWAVALVSLPALVTVFLATPTRLGGPAPKKPSLTVELTALRETPLQVNLALAVLINSATFCAFTYLAPVATDLAGLPSRTIPLVLALFGVGSFAGVWVAGRLGGRHWRALLTFGGVLLFAGWVLLALTAAHPAATLILAGVQGGLSFAVGSALIARVLATAPRAPTMGGAFATVALNLGATIGPVAGGIAFDGLEARGPLLASAGFGLLALAGWTIQRTALRSQPQPPGHTSPCS